MDESSLAAIQADLVAWGLLHAGPPVQLTRRARAAMARAAATLRDEEMAGHARAGNPLMLTVQLAISAAAPDGARATEQHHRYLAAVELASLPDSVRGMFG